MATITSDTSGNWNTGSTWVGGSKPADGDSVVIASGHTVTFDADLIGDGIDLAGLTITGILVADATPGDYTLLCSADIAGSGDFNIGSAVADYPMTCTFTIDFDSTASSIDGTAGLTCNFYCTQPTNAVIELSADEAAGQTELSVNTDITGDIWAVGDTVRIDDVDKGKDSEQRVIAAAGISSDHIDITAGLTGAKISGSKVVLITRNIKVTGTTYYAVDSLSDSVLGCEISGCTYGLRYSYSNTVSGSISGCTYGLHYSYSNTVSGSISGCAYGLRSSYSNTVSGSISGCTYGLRYSYSNTVSDSISGCTYGLHSSYSNTVSGSISGCTYGLYYSYSNTVSGSISGCTYGLHSSYSNTVSGSISGCTYGLYYSYSNALYGVDFSSTVVENSQYANVKHSPWAYTPSYNHDEVSGVFKAWTRGGIVSSQTSSPPVGYDKYYEHACEDADNYVFRQESISLDPGQTLRIQSVMQLPNGDDLSASAPTIEIIDPATDPLWGTGELALATATLPTADGSVTAWQTMSVISYKNTGSIPMDVIVRAKAKHAIADVNEAWQLDFDYPSAEDVEAGVAYGFDLVGNVVLPSESDVKEGTTYGASGSEFTGTFEQNVVDKPRNVIDDGIATGDNIIGR